MANKIMNSRCSIFKGKKVLITGATGFIGSNLARLFLDCGAHTFAGVRKESNTWRLNDISTKIELCCLDLLEVKRLSEVIRSIAPEIIIHTAVYGGFAMQKDNHLIYETNFHGTMNLLDCTRDIEYEAFINTGSSSEYGIKNQPMNEGDRLEPVTDYGIAKAAAAMYCRAFAMRTGKPVVTLRLFSPYGYYEDPGRLFPSVIMRCLHQHNPMLSSPEAVRDFVFIEDVQSAYVKAIALASSCPGEIFNIGSGRQYTVGEAVAEIVKQTGAKIAPQWKKLFNPRIEPAVWQADICRAKDLLGWEPEHSLEQGVRKTIEWFSTHDELYQ